MLRERISEFFAKVRDTVRELERQKMRELDQIFTDMISTNGSSSYPAPYFADLEELKVMKLVGEKHLENLIKTVEEKNFSKVAQDH